MEHHAGQHAWYGWIFANQFVIDMAGETVAEATVEENKAGSKIEAKDAALNPVED